MNQRIAVTGSSGFVGKELIKGLSSKGYSIIELDICNGIDLTKFDSLKTIHEFSCIVHLAAKSYVPESFKNPQEYYSNNLLTTINVLELARINKAKVIYLSSYLYGTPEYLPIDEDHSTIPHNPYAQSKLIGESLCRGYNRDFDVPVVIFRPFNIYGLNQNQNFLIPSIIDQIDKEKITLKDPRPKRDFIHVADVVEAIFLAIKNNNINFEVFNLGTGKSTSIKEIIDIIKRHSNTDIEVRFTNEQRKNEVLDCFTSTKKISDILKWLPKVTIEEGLEKLVKETINDRN